MIKDFIKKTFSDNNNQPSTNRVLTFFVVAVVISTWSWKCLSSPTWVEIGTNDMLVILGCITGKTIQRRFENNENK